MDGGGCSDDAAPPDVAERSTRISETTPPDMADCGTAAAETACSGSPREIGAVPREFGVLDLPSWVCPRIPYASVGAGAIGHGGGSGGGFGESGGDGSAGIAGAGSGAGVSEDAGVGASGGSAGAHRVAHYAKMVEAMVGHFRDPAWWELGIAALHCMDSLPDDVRGVPLAGCTVPMCAALRQHLESQRRACPPLQRWSFQYKDVHGRPLDVKHPLLLLDMELVADSYRRGFTKDDLQFTTKDHRLRPRDGGIKRKAFMVRAQGATVA